ncbi:MAG TPA: single-stranded DNA-binding protein [Cytophagales bacterium]|jgi:single-strand DNA-binding protein|nr:single-stranded DNA-binding protein [Cytophagales bacterium]
MQSMRNKVQLIGRLGMDPEVKTLESGKKMARVNIATTESYRDQKGNKIEDTQWHQVVCWGGLAEIAEKYLKKGREVAIDGKLVHRSYENGNGETKYITEVVANDLLMLGGK